MDGIITHEESQAVTKAFRAKGHTFFSCDLKPCSGGRPDWHFQDDVNRIMFAMDGGLKSWQFFGAHPDCTFLTNAGLRWLTSENPRNGYEWSKQYKIHINPIRWASMLEAVDHFNWCLGILEKVGVGYVENPVMHPYAMERIRYPYTQIIHPNYFGTPQRKATCLWIKGLPELVPDNYLPYPADKKERIKWQKCWTESPGPKRAENRSKTDPNVARAFAAQWG